MIRILLIVFIYTAWTELGAQTCLDSIFTTNGDGIWQLNSGQTGNTVADSLNMGINCLNWDNQPTGPYEFLYIVSTDCCSDTSFKNFYNMDIGQFDPLDFTICTIDDPVILSEQFSTFTLGSDADYSFSTSATGYIDLGDVEIDLYDPIDTLGTYQVIFTVTPIAPTGYTIDPNCIPIDYTFDIIVDDCGCNQTMTLTGICSN